MSNPRVYLDISINGSPPERIVIELFADVVPKTAENFRSLCLGFKSATGKHLHYKGCVFYQILKGFYAQTGDFEKQNGTGGESIYGRTFPDENFKLHHSGPGILSMGNSGPNKNGSRFIISFSRQPFLDGCHVVFGKVIKGIEPLQNIEMMGTSYGQPLGLVQITDCGEVSEDKKTNVLESDKPQSSLVTKEESEAKLRKDKDSKKYELSDEKLEAVLKNNKLVTNDNDSGLSSEKPSSNPNQQSDDPRKSRGDQSPVRKRSKKSESPISEDKKNNVTESDEKLEATLKNNLLVTEGNDREVSSEKPSTNPNQHSDDPRRPSVIPHIQKISPQGLVEEVPSQDLPAATHALLQRLAEESRQHTRRISRLEDLMLWLVDCEIERSQVAGIQTPPLPPPRQYPDEGPPPA